MADYKKHDKPTLSASEVMAEGAVLFRGLALPHDDELLRALDDVTAAAPFRHMVTPGGFTMSVHDQLRRGRLGDRPQRLS